ncbi:MAG: sugar phosphate nucleotidyltransferase [Thermodesulfobacteriaceae bacterium]
MKAFLLAAGKGERLLPYTQFLPKPLFPIQFLVFLFWKSN